jgi:hypothetical protein
MAYGTMLIDGGRIGAVADGANGAPTLSASILDKHDIRSGKVFEGVAAIENQRTFGNNPSVIEG